MRVYSCKQRNYITVDILAPYRCENSKREHSVVNFQKYKLLQTRDTPGGGGREREMESRDCKIINGFFLADVESVLVSIVFFFFFFSPFSFHYLSPKNCNVFSFLFHIYFDCVQWKVQPVRVVSEIRSEHELQTLWKDTRDGINYRKKSLFGIYSLNKFESFFFFFFLFVCTVWRSVSFQKEVLFLK